MALKFYSSVKESIKTKVRKLRGLIPTFGDVTEEEMVGTELLFSFQMLLFS